MQQRQKATAAHGMGTIPQAVQPILEKFEIMKLICNNYY
jgi:hypothetical protein